MSRWTEDFENHPIHETLNQVSEWLTIENAKADGVLAIEHRRLLKALSILRSTLSSIDPEVTPLGLVNQIHQHLRHQNFWNQLASFNASANANSLIAANDHMSAHILPAVLQLGAQVSENTDLGSAALVEKAHDDFCKSISKRLEDFESEARRYQGDLKKISEDNVKLEEEAKSLGETQSNLSKGWQDEFTQSQSQRENVFTDAEKNRKSSYEAWFSDFKKVQEEIASEFIKELTENGKIRFDEYQSKIREIETDADEKHQSILDLHGLVGEDSVAGGYKQLADHERDQANRWRSISIVFILLTAVWLCATYWQSSPINADGSTYLIQLLKAASLTGVLLFGAVFASKQSGLHRTNERKTRWFSLEVKAIGPFISSLDEPTQKELTAKFSDRLFAQNMDFEASGTNENHFDPNTLKFLKDLIKDIATAVRK